MDVLVVRHAVAVDKAEAQRQGMLDRDRPLTKAGRTSIQRVTRGLVTRVPAVTVLITSPWRRALETAESLCRPYRGLRPVASEALLPGAEPQALARELQQHASAGVIALVGHEPHLSSWVSWCLTGSTDGILELRKGGACLLRFEDTVGPRCGRLLWLMTPGVLRRL